MTTQAVSFYGEFCVSKNS